MERLQKIIAASGVCSRRNAEELIKKGKVTVNGETVTELGTKVTSDDVITVNGAKISTEHKVYYILNKPRGVISSVADDKKRTTVVELIDEKTRIFPVGRLDYDTTGLILLTNDGELSNILTHPKNNVPKTYVAKLEGILSMEKYFEIKKGIVIEGQKVRVSKIKIMKKDEKSNTTLIKITIHEGRNHIIKNLFEKVGHHVIKLKREEYAFLTLKNLETGEYRRLTLQEIEDLYTYKK